MARLYGIKLTDEQAQTAVTAWRDANPHIVSFWRDLNNTAILCMQEDPRQTFEARNGIAFRRNETVLAMRLPSGRHITYWYPKLKYDYMPWGEKGWQITYYGEDSQTHVWRYYGMYGGLLAENATQAVARDIMAHALVLLERRGMKPVLTVHDEAVCQLSKQSYPNPKDAAEAVRQVMLIAPDWTRGLSIAADASAANRYLKG